MVFARKLVFILKFPPRENVNCFSVNKQNSQMSLVVLTFPRLLPFCCGFSFTSSSTSRRCPSIKAKQRRQIMSLWSVSRRRKSDRPRTCHVTGRRATFKSCTCTTHTHIRTCHQSETDRHTELMGKKGAALSALTLMGKVN